MRRIVQIVLAGVAIFLLAAVAGAGAAKVRDGSLAGSPVVDDGTGTTLAQTQKLSARDGDILLTTVQQVCKTGYYVDGAVHARPCNTRDFDSGFWWSSLYRLVWNVPASQGGHSDIFEDNMCWHVGTGTECSTSFTLDGETEWQGTDRTAGTDSTAWVQVDNSVGGYSPNMCKRYYFSFGGGASTSGC